MAEKVKEKGVFGVWLNKWGIIALLLISGVAVIALAIYLSSIKTLDIVVGVITAVGGSLITAAVVDFVLMISTIKEYALLMVDNAYTAESLGDKSREKLNEIRENVENALLQKYYSSEIDGSFLQELDKEVLDAVMSDYYINSYKCIIHFNFDGKYITKRIYKKIECIKLKDGSVKIQAISSKKMVNIEERTIFAIQECKIDGKPFEVSCKSEPIGEGLYNIRYYSNEKYVMDSNSATLENMVDLVLPIEALQLCGGA